jgi:catechol 2,3-dioxygenase-like lactoylglutathione lyase family enzyme
MIDRLSHITIYVLNADEAKAFYTDTLGFKLGTDQGTGTGRWLTVTPPDQPDLYIALLEPETDVGDTQTAAEMRSLIAKGALGGAFFETKDCRNAYEQLTARGVDFDEEPIQKPYGIEATLRDDSGNRIVLLQH